MNKLESIIYDFVKDNPALKQKIVDIYQGILGLVPQKSIETDYDYIEREGCFYGFHDKSPFSSDGSKLLSHKVLVDYKSLQGGEEIEIGYFEGNDWKEYISLGKTLGWNWQLASMLQWFGDCSDKIIYNELEDGHSISIIKDLSGNFIKKFNFPIVHISPDQKYASSYNYFRAEKAMPGYGVITEKPYLNTNETDFFRVYKCDDQSIAFEISLAEAIKINHHPSMDGAFHFFHHSLFNPLSNRLFFLHRWVDNTSRRWTRMFSVNPDGTGLYLFPMDEMVSHITWASENEIFAYLRYPNQGDGYYLVEDKTGKEKRFFQNIFNSDGHPTMDKRRNIVITDTYPDRFRNQFLVLCKTDKEERINLCKTHLPSLFKYDLQVDLHPRLHPFLNIACVDAAFKGKHSLIILDFTEALK